MRHLPRFALVPILVLLARPAAASDPLSIYTVPTVVDILPDDATGTRVVIGGAFFFLSAPMTFTYTEPKCGYMSFQCPAGRQALCQMQWLDIRKAIGGTFCAGFGSLNMVSSATVRSDRSGPPDTWDLGMGVGLGSYVDGKCMKARTLNCAAPGTPPDATAPPLPPADAAPAVDVPITPPDTAVVTPPPADAASPPISPDAGAPADAAPAPTLAKSDGCAVGGPGSAAWPIAALLLALALGRRARRR